MQFNEFIDRKQREAERHLHLIEKLLTKSGMQVANHIDDENSYIFVKNPDEKISFGGVRVYEIGEMIVYRVQKEEDTHPFGKAYLLDIEDMFNDFMSENMKEEEAGKKVIESVVKELKKFFQKSSEAEDKLSDTQNGPSLILKSTGTDYGAAVLNNM